MKRNITLILITLCLAIGVVSCSEDSYPENPTLVSPISGLVLEVNECKIGRASCRERV